MQVVLLAFSVTANPGNAAAADVVMDAAAGEALGQFERYSYRNEFGTRSYKLYVPSNYQPGESWPLVVELHGCSSNADEEARWSRFNRLAEVYRVLVAYPEQTAEANGAQCWNWFLPDHQQRDAGEPSLIAGITRQVQEDWNVDVRRTYVGGVSAGGGMSAVMGVTYPDLYAAVMIGAGGEYKGLPCFALPCLVPPRLAGRWAYEAMGEHARVVPVLVWHGTLDLLSPYPNPETEVQQYLTTDDWADDGANNRSIPRKPHHTERGTEGHSYEVARYVDDQGCRLAERWLIYGMGHAWPHADPPQNLRDLIASDTRGPDLSMATLEFMLSHPMPLSGVACHEENG